jgi:predicted GNAT family acetyltransferase
MRLCRFSDASSFLGHAEAWLTTAEVENNLVLGICNHLLTAGPAPDTYLVTVEIADTIAACAIRVPPRKAIITRGTDVALRCLVDDLAAVDPTLPAVLGPLPDVARFAQLWGERAGSPVRPGMRQRILEVRDVRALPWPVPGRLRRAAESDIRSLATWIEAFNAEAHTTESTDPVAVARERVSEERLFVWENGEVVSMAAQGIHTPSGAGINLVYTPPPLRGRGYASACVAALSAHLLAAGRSYCCLFTDLANPTSNSIYQRIGYQPVCDMSDFILNAG